MNKWLKFSIPMLLILGLMLTSACAKAVRPPMPAPSPNLAIMVESDIIEAGSSFTVSGSNFKPGQKVWGRFEYRASDRSVGGVLVYWEANDNGLIYPTIEVPEDTVPGDYEVEIYIGKHLDDRELIATLPIHIQAKAK